MSSTPTDDYLRFLTDESVAKEQATIASISTMANLSSIISIISASSNYLILKQIADSYNPNPNYAGRHQGAKMIKRERLDMIKYLQFMDEQSFLCKYCMSKDNSMIQYKIIKPNLPIEGTKYSRGNAPNGNIIFIVLV